MIEQSNQGRTNKLFGDTKRLISGEEQAPKSQYVDVQRQEDGHQWREDLSY